MVEKSCICLMLMASELLLCIQWIQIVTFVFHCIDYPFIMFGSQNRRAKVLVPCVPQTLLSVHEQTICFVEPRYFQEPLSSNQDLPLDFLSFLKSRWSWRYVEKIFLFSFFVRGSVLQKWNALQGSLLV